MQNTYIFIFGKKSWAFIRVESLIRICTVFLIILPLAVDGNIMPLCYKTNDFLISLWVHYNIRIIWVITFHSVLENDEV